MCAHRNTRLSAGGGSETVVNCHGVEDDYDDGEVVLVRGQIIQAKYYYYRRCGRHHYHHHHYCCHGYLSQTKSLREHPLLCTHTHISTIFTVLSTLDSSGLSASSYLHHRLPLVNDVLVNTLLVYRLTCTYLVLKRENHHLS